MRDLIRLFLVGAILCFAPFVMSAEPYKVLILPDNIVTDEAAIDSFIYNQTAEFFAGEVITILNKTDYIKCPVVSEERQLLKSNPSYMIPARNLTNKYKNTYNIDYSLLKKVANASNTKYVLMLTSTIDAENYVLRRTVWDFLNIAGATVIDPAYKISTYAVLVDTSNNSVLWSDTFYKTISVVEARILTRGASPQTEQLHKIRDYSRMLCPEIAENVQKSILTDAEYAKESNKVYYDMANFDNEFTKKYRKWYKESKKDADGFVSNTEEKIEWTKEKYNNHKEKRQAKQAEKVQQTVKTEVKAEPYTETPVQPQIKKTTPSNVIQPLDWEEQTLFEPVNMKRKWKNRLLGTQDDDKPVLRGYDNL